MWSYNLYKAWFTYSLSVASRDPKRKPGCFPEPHHILADYKIQLLFPKLYEIQKFHCVFRLFLSCLDFALHSLRFIKYLTKKSDAKCWAFFNILFLWDIGPSIPGHFSGSINQLWKTNSFPSLKSKNKTYKTIFPFINDFFFQHYKIL